MKKLLLLIAILTSVFALSTPVFAYRTLNQNNTLLNQTIDPTGIKKEDLQTKIGSLIKGALTITGTVFFALMFYAGFLWMTAKGEEEPITKAKSTLLAAIIGLAIVISAYAITNIVTKLSQSASSRGGAGAGGSGAAGSSNQSADATSFKNQSDMCEETRIRCIDDCVVDLDNRVDSCNDGCKGIDPNQKDECLAVCNGLYNVSANCSESCSTVAVSCTSAATAQYEANQAQAQYNQKSEMCLQAEAECRVGCREQFPDTLQEQNYCIDDCHITSRLCSE